MEQKQLSEKWWQRPQPVWVSTLLSTLVLLAIFGLWNIIQQGGSAFEGDATTLETSQSATAQSTGGTVPYQGFVSNANGQPLNGNQTMSFALYAVSTGGTAVWGPETHTNIPVVEGLFAAVLGSKTTGGIPNSVWENGSLYVQITINGEALTPRELISPLGTASVALQSLGLPAVMQTGQIIATATEATSMMTAVVTFDPPFPDMPKLLAQPWFNYSSRVIVTSGCTGNSCTLFISRLDGHNWSAGEVQWVDWLAIGQ